MKGTRNKIGLRNGRETEKQGERCDDTKREAFGLKLERDVRVRTKEKEAPGFTETCRADFSKQVPISVI